MDAVIRPARSEEGTLLQQVERLAGEQFRDVGLPDVAEDEPPTVEVLALYANEGRSWVVVDSTDAPLGYVLVDVIDDCAHIEQLSVRPDRQGMGLGRMLVEHVRAWASTEGLLAITLTTFADVPWNAPLYRRLGFRVLAEGEVGPGLQQVVDAESAHGLDPAMRVCMRSELAG